MLQTAFFESGCFTKEVSGKADGGVKQYHIMGVIPYNKDSLPKYCDAQGVGTIFNIKPGAFTKSLQQDDQRVLWSHNAQYVLGKRGAGTVTFTDGADGLHFDCTLPNTTFASDVYESVARGDACGVSFGCNILKNTLENGKQGEHNKEDVLEAQLLEISCGVAFPAFTESEATATTKTVFNASLAELVAELAKRIKESDNKAKQKDKEGDEVEEGDKDKKAKPKEKKDNFDIDSKMREFALLEVL